MSELPPAAGFERMCDAPPFSVDFIDGTGDDLVIAFASVGHDRRRPPSPEFVATATGRGTAAHPRRALFVMDAARSWASDPGFAPALVQAVARVRVRAPVRRIASIGMSMGGFAALAAMQVLPVDVTLAFGPQFSPVLPGETRWADWTGRLRGQGSHKGASPPPCGEGLGVGETRPAGRPGPWAHAPLPGPGQGWACLFHGLVDDRAQAMAFPLAPGTDHLLFDGQSHSGLVPHLKSRGVLAGLVEAALAGDRRRLLRIAASAGGVRRGASGDGESAGVGESG